MYNFKKFQIVSEAVAKGCPIETHDLDKNLENRQEAFDDHLYGPVNPDNPGDFWKRFADYFKIDEKTAKTMTCGNCGAFDQSERMLKCMADGIQAGDAAVDGEGTVAAADLGYCTLLHFKCCAARTCNAWIRGGPLK